MKKYRSMTAAALVAVTGTVAAWSVAAQQSTQPGQRPTTPPGQTQRPTTPGRMGATNNERLFALEGAGAERQVQQLATRLSAIERQMEQTNTQLNQKVNQFNTMQGDQKVDAIAQCLQQIVNEHEQLHTYLVEIRTALTGEAGSEGVIPGRDRPGETPGRPGEPNRPGETPRPSTPPGQTPPR